MSALSRRAVVTGGLAATVGAALPLSQLAGTSADASESRPAEAAQRTSAVHSWQLATPNVVGKREKGATLIAHAQLTGLSGETVGTLRSSSVVSDIGGVGGQSGDLATQVLQLATSTLVGVGIAHARSLEGTFAIVGGTGAHAGARGSYRITAGTVHVSLLA